MEQDRVVWWGIIGRRWGMDLRFNDWERHLEEETYTLRPEGWEEFAMQIARWKKQQMSRHWDGREYGLVKNGEPISVAQESMELSGRRWGRQWPSLAVSWPTCAWPYQPWQSMGILFQVLWKAPEMFRSRDWVNEWMSEWMIPTTWSFGTRVFKTEGVIYHF